MDFKKILQKEQTFDPQDWGNMEDLAHTMIKDVFEMLKNVRKEKVWNEPPYKIESAIKGEKLPLKPQNINNIYKDIKENLTPYNKGNIHPKFWSWVQGTGTPFSVLSELLVAGLNPDVCTGKHSAMYIEAQVIEWLKKIMDFPSDASGVLVSGTSTANLTALLIARDAMTQQKVRDMGLVEYNSQLVLYASEETHVCIVKAADIIGIGKDAVRLIKTDKNYKIDIEELKANILEDKNNGKEPFCVVGNVGTVNTGAIDPIKELVEVCKSEKLWLHIDGSFGAFAKLVPEYKEDLKHLEQADSLSFDMHKWMSLPFGIGCLLVKEKKHHRRAFTMQPDYLQVHDRGLASGPEPIFNYGIEMTRGFRSLKIWMLLKEQGVEKIGSIIRQNIAQAFYLESLINKEKKLELLAPVTLNIVCFRYLPDNNFSNKRLDKLNKEIVIRLQESGKAATSHAFIDGKYCLRIANVNHRSLKLDFEELVADVLKIGETIKHTIQ